MKLELLDAYNIRARLSANIILLAPAAVTILLCFEELVSFASSSVLLSVFLAFTNYVPVAQRRICSGKVHTKNYAADFLAVSDTTLDSVSKKRYYSKLASLDATFSPFTNPNDSKAFRECCESAVLYLRNTTRDNRLVQEENITYGFCKNLFASKSAGITLCLTFAGITAAHSWVKFGALSSISLQHYFAFSFNLIMCVFWIFGVSKRILEDTAIRYAKTLLSSIDSFQQ